jgi:hypothetical protein
VVFLLFFTAQRKHSDGGGAASQAGERGLGDGGESGGWKGESQRLLLAEQCDEELR